MYVKPPGPLTSTVVQVTSNEVDDCFCTISGGAAADGNPATNKNTINILHHVWQSHL